MNLPAFYKYVFVTCVRLTDVGAWVHEKVLLGLSCKEAASSIGDIQILAVIPRPCFELQ